ncbi:ABC transporter permease [Clostridium carboxidivorans P7]|uniref:Putative ABC transporter, permease protein n=1 Tax=Clostridium carboxidivorans P7 TaxID=536227 RepID=C6PTG2_9CLOT|nr:ABC transporter permease [Clostridium carboxidivorans]AKN33731.1 ABC transporter permease [Clostridium carboxidivorans P7]EET87485.1 putative ABC transporter, permease protein [Clostridium carboxidivorans P7]EFG86670.1 membrane protein, putative [Clostridium carboxidivorans P7]
MRNLLWAELQKIRRSNIVGITIFATVMVAVIVFIQGWFTYNGSKDIDSAGWYMTMAQPLATIFVLPAVISLLGSYMICREEDEDTIKSLLLIPVNETKLIAAKMIITFLFSIFIYLLLFAIAFLTEAILHLSHLSVGMVLDFLKIYFLQGVGIFLAISPIIALVSYMKKGYWIALVLTEMYSFTGTFMSMSNTLKTFYPITAVFGVSGYYETTAQNRIESIIILLLCGCLSVFILKNLKYSEKN